MPGGRAGTPGASYGRTMREQESQEAREARLDRKHLRTNHLTPRQRWVPLLVIYIYIYLYFIFADEFQHIVKSCVIYNKIPFNFDTDFTKAFFGEKKDLQMSYADFTHFMQVTKYSMLSIIHVTKYTNIIYV